MSDKDFVVKNGLVVNNFLTVNATTIYVGNDVSNATVNTTVYSGTSNNTLYVGTVTAANVVSNGQLQSNLANYVRLDGLQANITKMHANSAVYLGASTDTEGDLFLYTNYARYTQPGTFSNNITINGNVVFANVNLQTLAPNRMIVVGNATFQNSVTITGSYLNTVANLVSFGSAVYVASNGNVGLANAAPADKLMINGNANVAGTLYVNGAVAFANTLQVTGAVTFSDVVTVNSLSVATNSATFGTAAVIYSNGNIGVANTAPADKLSVTGNVAVSDTIKVGTATINATNYSQTANNALYLGGTIASDFVTTSSAAGLFSSYYRKDSPQTVTANATFAANVNVSNGIVFDSTGYIVAAGSNGANGQALLSNGSGVYWGSVNTTVIVAPGEVSGNTYIVYNNNGTLASNAAFKFNFATNTMIIGTSSANVSINATSFSGTSNNALNLGGNAAVDFAKKDGVTYIGTTSIALNRSSASQTLTGVSIDGNANNAAYLGTVAAISYQLNSTLAANVATMTAGNTLYVGAVAAADMASKSYVLGAISTKADITGVNQITISNTATTLTTTSITGNGVTSTSTTGTGVYGLSNSGIGLVGISNNNAGVYGLSTSSSGVYAYSNTSTGVYARSDGNGAGGWFRSNTGPGIIATSDNVVATFSNNSGSLFLGIYANGNVGVGTNAPAYKLDVNGVARVQNDIFLTKGSSPYIGTTDSYNLRLGTGGADRVTIDTNGNVTTTNNLTTAGGITTGTNKTIFMPTGTGGESDIGWSFSGAGNVYLFGQTTNRAVGLYDGVSSTVRWTTDITGNFTAAGNVTAYSDIKLKTDIETIDNALDKVSRMRGVMYTRKDTGSRGTGVIAQEMQQILPEAVQDGETLSVAYGNIVGVLIEAIKELKAEIEQLKGK